MQLQGARKLLLMTLIVGVFFAWMAAAFGERILESYASLSDQETTSANLFSADVLDAPSSLSATPSSSIDLTWTASTDSYVTGYELFRRLGSGLYVSTPTYTMSDSEANCSGDSSCSFTDDSGLTKGENYCYQVRAAFDAAADSTPNFISEFSNEDCATEPVTTPPATDTLFPNGDKNNGTAGGNEWLSSATDNPACGIGTGAVCSTQIDEDIDFPTSDHVFNGNASEQSVEFELTNALDNLQTLTAVDVRFRASVLESNKDCELGVELFKADGTLLGSLTRLFTDDQAIENDSFTVSGLSLTKSEVDALYVTLTNVASTPPAGGTCQVYTVNLDISYTVTP